MSILEIEARGTTRLLYLNSPPANGLNVEMVAKLTEAAERLMAEADKIRCLIIASRLERVFVAGADIKMIKQAVARPDTAAELLTYNRRLQRMINQIETLPFPVIAAINGYALGGGLELALACDFRFMATEGARVGLPEAKLGLLPAAGGTQRLSRLVGKARAKDIIYCSRMLDANEALALGIVDRVAPPLDLLDECLRYADAFGRRAAVAIAEIKACINEGLEKPIDQGLDREMVALERLLGTADLREGTTAFVEKRDPQFLGK